jgi:hypothetical protein
MVRGWGRPHQGIEVHVSTLAGDAEVDVGEYPDVVAAVDVRWAAQPECPRT